MKRMKPKRAVKLLSLGTRIFGTMDIQAEKLLLIEQLLQLRDVKVIEKIRQLLEKSYNPIVGYEPDGKPITQQDFIKQIEQAEKDYESGNHQNIDEIERETETWSTKKHNRGIIPS